MSGKVSNATRFERLLEGGWNKPQLAEALGLKGTRFIDFVLKGEKPANNYTNALKTLERRAVPIPGAAVKPVDVPRRVNKQTGAPVPGRQSGRKAAPVGTGETLTYKTRVGPKFVRDLERAAREGRNIRLTVTVSEIKGGKSGRKDDPTKSRAKVNLFEHYGQSAQSVLDKINDYRAEGQSDKEAVNNALRGLIQDIHEPQTLGDVRSAEMFEYGRK